MADRASKKRRTRQRLTDAALELFAEHGYEATTVEAIAERAGVSARTFFRYFEAKEVILTEPGSRLIAAAAQLLGDVPPGDRDATTVVEVIAELLSDEDLIRPIEIQAFSARSSSPLMGKPARWRQRWARELAEHLADADGRERPTLAEHAICAAALAVMGAVFDEWFRLGGEADVVSLARQAAAAVFDNRSEDPRRA